MLQERRSQQVSGFVLVKETNDRKRYTMIAITDEQRHVLVEHALSGNWSFGLGRQGEEARFADVIADLATDRDIGDHDLLVRFLWQRVALAVHAGFSYSDHRAWSVAVEMLDQLGENLEGIFSGRHRPAATRS
jgi:hypothetical protein